MLLGLFHLTRASLHCSNLNSLTDTPRHGIQLPSPVKISHLTHLKGHFSCFSGAPEPSFHPCLPLPMRSHCNRTYPYFLRVCVLMLFLIKFHSMTPIPTPKATHFLSLIFRFSLFAGNVSKLCQLQHFISTFLIYAPRSLMKMLNKMSQTDP